MLLQVLIILTNESGLMKLNLKKISFIDDFKLTDF